MMKLTLVFIFFCFTLTGCGEGSGKVTTGNEHLGSLKLHKTCTGGGSINVYQKTTSTSSTTGPTTGGTVTIKGAGLKVSMPGCPSTISFQCTSTGWTEAAVGNNVSPNERFTCNGGKATFSPVSGTQTTSNPSLNPYPNPYQNPSYTSPTSKTYQYDAKIDDSNIWLIGQGPLKKPGLNVFLQFQITAGRYIPLSCGAQFVCP